MSSCAEGVSAPEPNIGSKLDRADLVGDPSGLAYPKIQICEPCGVPTVLRKNDSQRRPEVLGNRQVVRDASEVEGHRCRTTANGENLVSELVCIVHSPDLHVEASRITE